MNRNSMTVIRLSNDLRTPADVVAWAEHRRATNVRAHLGPDGLFRGTATVRARPWWAERKVVVGGLLAIACLLCLLFGGCSTTDGDEPDAGDGGAVDLRGVDAGKAAAPDAECPIVCDRGSTSCCRCWSDYYGAAVCCEQLAPVGTFHGTCCGKAC